MIALTILPALDAPCRAQSNQTDIPVLKLYAGRDWIYFAPASDGALIFENQPGDASNIWVAVERASANRRVLAKTDIWTDVRGRLHTVNVLKRQMEFNDYVRELHARHPNLYWGGYVNETGILDFATLATTNTKLYTRVKKIANRLDTEEAAAKILETTDPNVADNKRNFSSYVKEKVWAAKTLLDELNRLIFAVPQLPFIEEDLPTQPYAGALNGLRGLEVPAITPLDLELAGSGAGVIRFVSVFKISTLEGNKTEIVDHMRMTPEIAAGIQAKEAAAEKAVSFAEVLCKDLLTPPCE